MTFSNFKDFFCESPQNSWAAAGVPASSGVTAIAGIIAFVGVTAAAGVIVHEYWLPFYYQGMPAVADVRIFVLFLLLLSTLL